MKSIKERNPAAVGLVTLVLITLAAIAAYRAQDLPVIGGGGTEYTAQFSESAGLNPSDEVRVAGIRVGKVTDVKLNAPIAADRLAIPPAFRNGADCGTTMNRSSRCTEIVPSCGNTKPRSAMSSATSSGTSGTAIRMPQRAEHTNPHAMVIIAITITTD